MRRELNCNMVRCSHYPQSAAFYDACDELGLMAWEEAPGWGYPAATCPGWRSPTGYRGVDRPRPQPPVDHRLGRAAQRDPPPRPVLYPHERAARSLDDSRPTAGAMAGLQLTTNYEQDVFGEDDYSSVTRGRRVIARESKGGPAAASGRAGKPYLVSEAVGTLSGPASTTGD